MKKNAALSTDQLAQMRQVIKQHVSKSELLKGIKSELVSNPEASELVSQAVLKHVDTERITNEIIKDIDSAMKPKVPGKAVVPRTNNRAILLRIKQGKSFLDYLDSQSEVQFVISVSFQRQRFRTVPILASADPIFDQTFVLDLSGTSPTAPSSGGATALIDLHKLLKLSAPIHICLLKRIQEAGLTKTTVMASKSVEWRYLLSNSQIELNCQLHSLDRTRAKAKVGVLLMHLDLLPKPKMGERLLHEHLIEQQLILQEKYETESVQQYIDYTTQWWKDFKNSVSAPENRIVKLFVSTDDIENNSYKPACSIVRPLQSRYIETPYHAARFVSLFRYEKSVDVMTPAGLHERHQIWHNLHSFLARGCGDVENHALLLCCLLLGFGLDAWICVGTSGEGAHAWVVTLDDLKKQGKGLHGGKRVTFWQSLTGERQDQDDPKVHRFYRTLGCVFNHKRFYANIQPDVRVFCSDFNFRDPKLWKGIDPTRIEPLPPVNSLLDLRAPSFNEFDEALFLESELKQLIRKERLMESKHDTVWDQELSFILTPALVNYEQVRISGGQGGTFGNKEFAAAVKNMVPQGHTFKAFPIEFKHMNCERMFFELKKNKTAGEIISARGDMVRHGMRVKVVSFPEEKGAVWVMIAVRFRSTF